MSSAASPTESDLLDDLKQFAHRLNKTPTQRELTEYGPHSVWKYEQEFGSWNAALRAADLAPNLVHNISSETLKKDLERVAGVLGKAPSLNEMDRFGEYSSQTYVRKLESYVETLEELGLDPDPYRYNGTNQNPPREKQATKNVRELRNEGPLPSSELPNESFGVNDKRHGMARFSIKTGRSGKPESVFYLFEEHNPKVVLRVFFETHPKVVENLSSARITEEVSKYGSQWKKALRLLRASQEQFSRLDE